MERPRKSWPVFLQRCQSELNLAYLGSIKSPWCYKLPST